MLRSKLVTIVVIVIAFSTLASAVASETDVGLPPHHVIHCLILDKDGKLLRNYGSGKCQFFPDGSMVMGTNTKLSFYNKDMSVRWSKNIHTHHQINLSLDSTKLLVMTSSVHKYKNQPVRFDRLSVVDLEGRELYSFDFYPNRKTIDRLAAFNPPLWKISESELFRSDVVYEFSHANSFYEIGENESARAIPAFAKGNYIVHVNMRGLTLILSSDLRRVLWSKHLTWDCLPGHFENIHDVQVSQRGTLLYYNNFGHQCDYSVPRSSTRYSDIEEYDPANNTKKILFKPDLSINFYSSFCGGVQELANGNILTSDNFNGGYASEFDAKGLKVWSIPDPYTNPRTDLHLSFQQIRRMDLTSFLKNNSGF